MLTLKSYATPGDYLAENEAWLEQNEIVNNLILGICNNFSNKKLVYPGCYFITCFDNGAIQTTSIKTISKAIVAGASRNIEHVKPLCEFYLQKEIGLGGVVGEAFLARKFASIFHKGGLNERTLIVHELRQFNPAINAQGGLLLASEVDLNLLLQWAVRFEEETNTFPRKTSEELRVHLNDKLWKKALYIWTDNDEVVSMAAIVRQTKNIAIVGLVYTPPNRRGKGYACACVGKLTETILARGQKNCGLFTDKSNPTSNSIYRKIGYVPVAEQADIQFV
jgi:predicted GNAT family acetyltransferase